MKYWEDMSENEKDEFCRNSKCQYYFAEIDACMCDDDLPWVNTDKKCHGLLKPKKKHIKDSTELSGGHLW